MNSSIDDLTWVYDVFVSYARQDDLYSRSVSKLIDEIAATFHSQAGRSLRLFLDTVEVRRGSFWKVQTLSAIRTSALFIVFETPSYLSSSMCAWEWDEFRREEDNRRAVYQLEDYESLIFPVSLVSRGQLIDETGDATHRATELSQRQRLDLVNVDPDSEAYRILIERLARDVASMLGRLSARFSGATLAPSASPHGRGPRSRTSPLVDAYHGADSERLTSLLTEARAATIVGVTNTWLPECLEAAIARRVTREDRDAFWERLQIVFLGEELLPLVLDDLSFEFSDSSAALRERTLRAGQIKRRVMSLLIRSDNPGRWSVYSSPHMLSISGAHFSMPGGGRVVNLAVARTSRNEVDDLYLEFFDRVDDAFEAPFRGVVENSREEHELVMVGCPTPAANSFLCRAARFRRGVLVPGRNTPDWLAAVLVITWRAGQSGAEPLLQVNTPHNSTREMGKASHVSGYINQRDVSLQLQEGSVDAASSTDSFELPLSSVEAAVRRELADDFGIANALEPPRHRTNLPFYYHDKENLFFYVLEQQLDQTAHFPESCRMFSWGLSELVQLRRHQVLRHAHRTLQSDLSLGQRRRAGELLIANLALHGESALGNQLSLALAKGSYPPGLKAELSRKIDSSAQFRYSAGEEIRVDGLAGLQYRAFFTALLPAYADIGVRGADELLERIRSDEAAAKAISNLELMYSDEEYMSSLPIEV